MGEWEGNWNTCYLTLGEKLKSNLLIWVLRGLKSKSTRTKRTMGTTRIAITIATNTTRIIKTTSHARNAYVYNEAYGVYGVYRNNSVSQNPDDSVDSCTEKSFIFHLSTFHCFDQSVSSCLWHWTNLNHRAACFPHHPAYSMKEGVIIIIIILIALLYTRLCTMVT